MHTLHQSHEMAVRVIREIVDITDVYNDETDSHANRLCPSGNSFELSVLTALNIVSYLMNLAFLVIVWRVPMFRGVARHVVASAYDSIVYWILRPRVGENVISDREQGTVPSIEIIELQESEQPLSHT